MPRLRTTGIAALASAVCVIASLPLLWIAAHRPEFAYQHAWVSAHFATMARSFARLGAANLHFLPIQNNVPLTSEPDAYLNWPPLFAHVLRWVMEVVGDVPLHLHLVMAGLALVTAAALGRLAWQAWGRAAGVTTLALFLLLPITLKYGSAVLHIHLALILTVAAVGAVWQAVQAGAGVVSLRWWLTGMGLFVLAVWTSWEPLLVVPGLAVAFLFEFRRNTDQPWLYRGLGAVVLAGGAALLGVLALYGTQAPWALDQIRGRMLMRAGLADYQVAAVRVHGLAEFVDSGLRSASWSDWLSAVARDAGLLGPVATTALVLAVVAGVRSGAGAVRWLIWPLASMPVCWMILMRQHFIVHEYEAAIFAPPAALAGGWLVSRTIAQLQTAQRPRQAAIVVALAGLAWGVGHAAWTTPLDENGAYERAMIDSAALIRRHVPAGDVVLTPEDSMVLVYYADRHVIRGLRGDADLAQFRRTWRSLCAGCGMHLAIPPERAADFAQTTPSAPLAAQSDDLLLYRLGTLP